MFSAVHKRYNVVEGTRNEIRDFSEAAILHVDEYRHDLGRKPAGFTYQEYSA
jgi:hypothetical protein